MPPLGLDTTGAMKRAIRETGRVFYLFSFCSFFAGQADAHANNGRADRCPSVVRILPRDACKKVREHLIEVRIHGPESSHICCRCATTLPSRVRLRCSAIGLLHRIVCCAVFWCASGLSHLHPTLPRGWRARPFQKKSRMQMTTVPKPVARARRKQSKA